MADKTGTLTKRKFKVKLCSIHGKLFSFQMDDINNNNYISKMNIDNFEELEISKEAKSKTIRIAKKKNSNVIISNKYTSKIMVKYLA